MLLIGGSQCHTDLKNVCTFHIMGIFVMLALERNMTLVNSVLVSIRRLGLAVLGDIFRLGLHS